MKRRLFGLLLFLALLLTACGGESEPKSSVHTVYYNGTNYYVDVSQGTITCGEDIYRFFVDVSGNTRDTTITYPNGAKYYWNEGEWGGSGGWSDGYDPERYVRGNELIHIMDNATPAPRERQGHPVVGFILIILGALNVAFPYVVWHLRYGWHFKDAEPSDQSISWIRVCGGIVVILGIVMFFVN